MNKFLVSVKEVHVFIDGLPLKKSCIRLGYIEFPLSGQTKELRVILWDLKKFTS